MHTPKPQQKPCLFTTSSWSCKFAKEAITLGTNLPVGGGNYTGRKFPVAIIAGGNFQREDGILRGEQSSGRNFSEGQSYGNSFPGGNSPGMEKIDVIKNNNTEEGSILRKKDKEEENKQILIKYIKKSRQKATP